MSDNEDLHSTILQTIQFDHERKESCGNESHEKETNHIHASATDLLHIRIVNFDWCKYGHCKNEAREIDCLCCQEIDAMLIALAKISAREGSILPFSFHEQLPDF